MLARQIMEGEEVPDLPGHAVRMLAILSRQALGTDEQIRQIGRDLLVLQNSDEMARRLASIPRLGPVEQPLLPTAVTDPRQFRPGCQFAAWLDPTPLQHPSGGKERLGRISKMGDKYLLSVGDRGHRAGPPVPAQARQDRAAFCLAAGA